MARVRCRVAGDEGTQIGIGDPVEQSGAEHAGSKAAFAGDDKHAARAKPGLTQDEVNDFAVSRILRVTVKIDAGVDLVLAATDAALTGKVVRRARPSSSRARRLPPSRRFWLSGQLHRRGSCRLRLVFNDLAGSHPHGARDA